MNIKNFFVKLLFLTLGGTLLFWSVNKVDLNEVWLQTVAVGWSGLLVIISIYFIAFLFDTVTWAITLSNIPLTFRWLMRILCVRLTGEALNNLIPVGGVGGEPVKAILLNTHYKIDYRVGTASLVLAKTINMVSLCMFLVFGFALMISSVKLSIYVKQISMVGLAVTLGFTFLLIFAQRSSFILMLTWITKKVGTADFLIKLLNFISDFEVILKKFYTSDKKRLTWAILLALSNWLLGAVEVYYAMVFLGVPITLTEAYIIEAVAQMVRMSTFFIPMSLGAQEGTFLFLAFTMTGSSSVGLSLGVVRRIREFFWIGVGFAIGLGYSAKKTS